MDDLTHANPDRLAEVLLTLSPAGIRTGAVKVAGLIDGAVIHADDRDACTQAKKLRLRMRLLSLQVIALGTKGRLCDSCLALKAFRVGMNRPDLVSFVSATLTALDLVTAHENELRPFDLAVTEADQLEQFARILGADSNPILSAGLLARVASVVEAVKARQRSSEGYQEAARHCAEVRFPMPLARSTADPVTLERLEALVQEQRDLSVNCPNWVFAGPNVAHWNRTRVSNEQELLEYEKRFTSGQLLVVPSVVFDSIHEMNPSREFVVVPEKPSSALVETLSALYDPRSLGPYRKLRAALDAALALA